MQTMSARNFPRKRARCTTARSSTARSTARPRPRKPRRWTRKASNSIRCRSCRTSGTSAPISSGGHMTEHKGLPIFHFANARGWNAWLDKNEKSSSGLWLKFARKNAGAKSISKAEAIEIAIAHGWIDGQLASYDERFWLVRFTRRGRNSKWSQVNRATAIGLLEDGRMKPSGLRAVDLAKADG